MGNMLQVFTEDVFFNLLFEVFVGRDDNLTFDFIVSTPLNRSNYVVNAGFYVNIGIQLKIDINIDTLGRGRKICPFPLKTSPKLFGLLRLTCVSV